VLRQHPVVREAVVITQEDTPGDKQLIAYILPKLEQSPTVIDLRSFLKTKLPDYMIPSVFVMLEALPLTPSGKVDRRALPAPDQGRPEVETAFAKPRDSLELQLTKIWEEIFGMQPIGVRDDFFELGGHSLLAVKLTAQIEKAFGKHFPPAALFQAPTIEQLATVLRQEKWSDSWSSLVPIQPGGSKLPFFWIHGDSSNAFLPRYLGPNQPLYGLMHQSEDGKPALYTKVETIAAHYLKEIRTVQPEGPYFLGGYSFGGTVAFEMAQQLKKQGQDVPLLVLLDSHFPGDDIPDSRSVFRTEAQRHLRNLALLGPQEKLAYVLVKVKDRSKSKIMHMITRTSKILKKVLCKVYLSMGRSIPPSLRSPYILDIYRQARRNYVPQLYPGRAIYFKAEKRSSDQQLNWGRLIAGGLEAYEMPGDHVDMIKEPNAHFWAEKLKACLYKAQSKEASRQPHRLQEGVESTVNNRPILPSEVRLR
jgi:thioesterase domain-containing protein/acyl carrier protein